MRIIVASSLVLLLSCGAVARAGSDLDSATMKQLTLLERKFFGHTFDSDNDDGRAGRLEQLIFGEVSSGAPQERIQKIIAVSPLESAPVPPEKTITTDESVQPTSMYDGESEEVSDYPHVSSLESVILGKNYSGQRLPERLSRLETKAFGHASTSNDFSQRTDDLEQFAEKNLHAKPFAQNNSDSETVEATGVPGPETGASEQTASAEYPHITALERNILGETYSGQPLTARLTRLETTAFGGPSKNSDLSQRTDALESYSQKKLHKKSFQPPPDRGAAAVSGKPQGAGSGMSKQLIAMAANTLLSAAGLGGVGMGLAGAGMGLGVMRQQQQQQKETVDKTVTQQECDEDPSVSAHFPPPETAKLLTKVAWCEAQIFGHTFPSMHLKERLRQLSQELHFGTGKTDLQLMDDVGGLVKAVQAQKGNVPIGAAPGGNVH